MTVIVGPVLKSPIVRIVNAFPDVLETLDPEFVKTMPIVAALVLPDVGDLLFGRTIDDRPWFDIDASTAVVWNEKGAKMSTRSTFDVCRLTIRILVNGSMVEEEEVVFFEEEDFRLELWL